MQFETTLGEKVFNIELNEDQSSLNLNGNIISYQLQRMLMEGFYSE
jgi:hypothetical protein